MIFCHGPKTVQFRFRRLRRSDVKKKPIDSKPTWWHEEPPEKAPENPSKTAFHKSTWRYTLNTWGFTGSGSGATMNQARHLWRLGPFATLKRQHHTACTKVCATLLSFCHGLRPFGAIGPTLHHRGRALISRKRANYSDQTPAK